MCAKLSQLSGMVLPSVFQYALCVGLILQNRKGRRRRTTMPCEENKAVVSRFVDEFWNQGKTSAADELMTADATIVLPGSGQVSKESFKQFVTTIRFAFPHSH